MGTVKLKATNERSGWLPTTGSLSNGEGPTQISYCVMAVKTAATATSILYIRQKRVMVPPNLGLGLLFGISLGDEAQYGGWMRRVAGSRPAT
jgi:hypothetical protein